jgi:hypothetical protein
LRWLARQDPTPPAAEPRDGPASGPTSAAPLTRSAAT